MGFTDEELAILVSLKDLASAGLHGVSTSVATVGKAAETNSPKVDKLSKSLENASKPAGALKNVLTGFGQGLGLAGIGLAQQALGGLTGFITDSTEAAKNDALSQAQLGTAIRANVANWTDTTGAVEDYISTAQVASDFTKDELRTSLESLVGATKNVTTAEKLQTTATNLARFSHIDLKTATQTLVDVEAGRFRGLASLGINVKSVTSSQDALNRVNAIAAGQDQTYLDSEAGKLDALSNKLDEIKVQVGQDIAPAQVQGLTWVDDAIKGLGVVGRLIENLSPNGQKHPLDPFVEPTGGWIQYQNAIDNANEQTQHFTDQVTSDFAHAADGFQTFAVGAGSAFDVSGAVDQATIKAHLAIQKAQGNISDDWDALETQVYKTVKRNGKDFQVAVKGAYTPTLDLTPIIVPDSTRLKTLFKQLATAEGWRLSAVAKGDSKTVADEDANITKLENEIAALEPRTQRRAAGGSLTGGRYVFGDGGNGQFAESVVLNPGSSGYVVPDGGHMAGGSRGDLNVHFNLAFPPTRQQAREIAEMVNNELGLKLSLQGGSAMFSGG